MNAASRIRRPEWLRTPPPDVIDVLIAVAFVAGVTVDRVRNPLTGTAEVVLGWSLTLAVAGALCVRRRYPLTAFVVGAVAVPVESLAGIPSEVTPYGSLLLTYSVALYGTRIRALSALPVIVASVVAYFSGSADRSALEPAGVMLVWLVIWALGYSTARRREEQQRSRLAIRRQILAEEQTRMARELHDVIGHTVNLLVVQAGAARVMLDTNPTMTRSLLAGMESTGREALDDLDQVLGTLRRDAPGLAQLPELIRRLGVAQVDVTMSVDSDIRLPHNLDLSAYRIIQEALTNVLKHAAPCSATVTVRRDDGIVVVEVSDDGPGPAPAGSGGRGLKGMVERVSAFDGVVHYGPGSRGGFIVRAELPVP